MRNLNKKPSPFSKSLSDKNTLLYNNCQAITDDIMEAIFDSLQTCSFCGRRKKVYPVVVDDDGGQELWCEYCIERNQ